jgi:hypothetical protein
MLSGTPWPITKGADASKIKGIGANLAERVGRLSPQQCITRRSISRTLIPSGSTSFSLVALAGCSTRTRAKQGP